MKKFIVFLGLLICTNAHAGIVSLDTISADSTISVFNSNFTKLANANNGAIQGSGTNGSTTNILSRSLGELDMADEINPRVRANEILGIGVDTTTTQTSFVYTGLTPATSASLTSNISTGTAYVNGYRVNKSATAETYTASKDTYVDLSQTGAFTLSPVTNGAAAPSVAANSARLAKVVTNGTAITGVTDLANRKVPGLVVPTNYRSGLYISRDSTTTLTVFPGSCETNGAMVSKTGVTTLTLNTAGDWAGGSSLQAVSTYGYVGIDTSGNLKLHTTAPTNQNYALTVTAGKLRYATWSSTVYRILGWFYMNATGSGQLNSYEVGNIKEGDVPNFTSNQSSAQISTASTTALAADTSALSHFYSSGNPANFIYNAGLSNGATSTTAITISVDSVGITGNFADALGNTSSTNSTSAIVMQGPLTIAQGTHTIQGYFKVSGSTGYVNNRTVTCEEE